MNLKVMARGALAVSLLGLGMLAGSVVGPGGAFAQTASSSNSAQAVSSVQMSTYAQAAATATPGSTSGSPARPSTTITAKLTQQQAEQAALAAAPGSTIDHTTLQNQNGTPVYDVDFTNGGGVLINGDTGAVIQVEAAGTDQGGRGGHKGGANQAALAAQAKVTQQQAEQAALAAAAGSTVDHSNLQMQNGTVVWDVDFTN